MRPCVCWYILLKFQLFSCKVEVPKLVAIQTRNAQPEDEVVATNMNLNPPNLIMGIVYNLLFSIDEENRLFYFYGTLARTLYRATK